MSGATALRRSPARLIVLGCVLALVLSAAMWWVAQASGTRITAYFDKAVGVYTGSSVRVLGVEVGKIDAVTPQGGVVRVDMKVDEETTVPADAKAVVVAPSLVSDRYVQLTPAYTGGPVMASGAVIPKEKTTTPAELDDLYRSANALSEALGPQGANENGALTDVLNTTSANLEGNGQDLNTSVRRLGELATTLSESQNDLFSTVDNLNRFTATLADSDRQIRQFHGRVADVTGFLAAEREQVGSSLGSLATALTEVDGFLRDNREPFASNVHNLTGVTQALVNERAALAEVLDVAPLAATNFVNAYDAASGSVPVRGHINELTNPPILMVCKLIEHSTPQPIPQDLAKACDQLAPVLDGRLKLPSVGQTFHHLQQGTLPPLPLPVLNTMPLPQGGGPR